MRRTACRWRCAWPTRPWWTRPSASCRWPSAWRIPSCCPSSAAQVTDCLSKSASTSLSFSPSQPVQVNAKSGFILEQWASFFRNHTAKTFPSFCIVHTSPLAHPQCLPAGWLPQLPIPPHPSRLPRSDPSFSCFSRSAHGPLSAPHWNIQAFFLSSIQHEKRKPFFVLFLTTLLLTPLSHT